LAQAIFAQAMWLVPTLVLASAQRAAPTLLRQRPCHGLDQYDPALAQITPE